MTAPAAPLDRLFDADPRLAGRVAAAVLGGRRFPATPAEVEKIRDLVPAGLVRTFRDGSQTWIEAND